MPLLLDIVSVSGSNYRKISKDCEETGWTVVEFDSIGDFLSERKNVANPVLIIDFDSDPDPALLDNELPGLITWHKKNPATQVILFLTRDISYADRLALKIGARHTLFKPYNSSDLVDILSKTAGGIGKRQQIESVRKHLQDKQGFDEIIGTSPKIREVIDLARRIGQSDFTSVMITGENGTGKGALAKAIHNSSSRASGPFIEVNCAAIPRNLMESEFFGHEKGAFTDAKERKLGLFEMANGGTIFMDEVGEIDYSLQAKLLKFLDSRTIRRVSGTQFLPVDLQIISATNRDLRQSVENRQFRIDLFYRLNVIEITLPPLRDRLEDIKPIADHYVKLFAERLKKGVITITDDAYNTLMGYSWPGNIRELINLIERAVLLNTTGSITPRDLPFNGESPASKVTLEETGGRINIDLPPDGISLAELEKAAIISALEKSSGNITRAASFLRIERGTIRYKMKKLGIDPAEIKEKIKNGKYQPTLITN